MYKAIDMFYPYVAKDREKAFGFPNKKAYPVLDLSRQYLAFRLYRQGENILGIANKMDEVFPGEDTLPDSIRMTLGRIRKSSDRFKARTR
jgi:hypothetical protein